MDQDSTNGTSSDKPKWRDRLGIGAKDMPRISDEFKPPPAKSDGRGPQPVTKLAPMAPRTPAQPPEAVAPEDREPQRAAEFQNVEGLAEKLRGQRAAAEMLAVQRVSAARQRAEARISSEPRSSMPRVVSNDAGPKDITPSRPKFSFADDDQPAKRQEPALPLDKSGNGARNLSGIAPAPSLVPPRPALGGERPQPFPLRQSGSAYRPDATPPFRPIDPGTGYPGPSSRGAPPPGQWNYPQEPGGALKGDRSLTRKPAYDPFRRGHDAPSYGADTRRDDLRGDPRFGHTLSARGNGSLAGEELDDVFEDEAPPPRRRAGASDYQSAYREAEEDGTDNDRRRSNGPWLLLFALLVAAVATGGVILLWNKSTETMATNGTGATDAVPVVAAPEQPAKTAAEKPADGAGDVAAVNRKQIYDRIVGDQEVTGDKVVPTEVTPIQPEASESRGASQPAESDELPDEAVPLVLPPAPGQNTEGSIDRGADQRVVATAGQSETEEIKSETTSRSGDSIGSVLPATGAEEEDAAPSDTTSLASTDSSSAASVEPEPQPAPPVRKKSTAAKKKKPPADSTASLSEPVVVVSPGEVIAPSQETLVVATLPADPAPAQPPVRRKRTLFDLFNGAKNDAAPAQDATVKQPAPQASRLASLPVETVQAVPEKPTAPQTPTVASGYVVQLASFRNEDEAQAEYARLREKYASVIGTLPSSISQTTVAGSTRHTLGLGPLTTQEQGSQICSSLLAGGERDCRVRKQ